MVRTHFLPKPLGNKILVQPEKKQERTSGGLIIPAVVNKDVEEGTIIDISPETIHLKAGDKILYPTGAGITITIENETYRFICGPIKDSPGDVIAIINEPKQPKVEF